MGKYNDLLAFKKAFQLAKEIQTLTNKFPSSEKYGLTSQIRRSSRSVCSNIAEGYRKRIYPAHFISKLSDADMENTETQVWLDFSEEYKYISKQCKEILKSKSEEIGKLLNYMQSHPEKFS